MIDRLQTAMFNPAFPCNPIPFALGLAEHVISHGTDSIQSDEAKRILWVLMTQAYGQLASIDLSDEWSRLEPIDDQPAKITSIKRESVYGSCTLFATYDNGMEKLLFSYYLDELAFSDADLIGSTEDEAHKLRHNRDVAYLQS